MVFFFFTKKVNTFTLQGKDYEVTVFQEQNHQCFKKYNLQLTLSFFLLADNSVQQSQSFIGGRRLDLEKQS